MKFSIKDFFSKYDQTAISYGFGHIYWRNPYWKTSFLCNELSSMIKYSIVKLNVWNIILQKDNLEIRYLFVYLFFFYALWHTITNRYHLSLPLGLKFSQSILPGNKDWHKNLQRHTAMNSFFLKYVRGSFRSVKVSFE